MFHEDRPFYRRAWDISMNFNVSRKGEIFMWENNGISKLSVGNLVLPMDSTLISTLVSNADSVHFEGDAMQISDSLSTSIFALTKVPELSLTSPMVSPLSSLIVNADSANSNGGPRTIGKRMLKLGEEMLEKEEHEGVHDGISDTVRGVAPRGHVSESQINSDEQRTIVLMWSKIIGESECVTVTRFQKQGYRLGIKITTRQTHLGYMHEIVNIADKSSVSKQSAIQTGDIILEVNGVNLLLLNYDQLALTLGGLPNNVQFVLWKKEGEGVYEKPDNFDFSCYEDHYHIVRDPEDTWRSTITIIVQTSQHKTHGLEFINSIQKSRSSSQSVIKKINKDGYFYDDRRICINDSILMLNGKDLRDYSDRDMDKIFTGNKRCAFSIAIRKYNTTGYNSDVTSISGSKMSLSLSSKDLYKRSQFIQSAPNLTTTKFPSKSMRIQQSKKSPTKETKKSESTAFITPEYDTMEIQLDQSDDLKIYLVDIQETEKRKSIIYGFHPDSSLRKKFQFKDQIIKINEEDTRSMSSKEIGHHMKKYFQNTASLSISVLRKHRDEVIRSNDSLIAASDILTTESESPSNTFSSCHDGETFCVTLCKMDNSFGLRIVDKNGPTIVEIIPDSVAEKSGLVKVDDKIVKINDIYVMDKDQNFVLTMIRSCGDRINIELLRNSSIDSNIQFMENQTYFSFSPNLNPISSDPCYDSKHSIFLPLPPVPENEVNKESINPRK